MGNEGYREYLGGKGHDEGVVQERNRLFRDGGRHHGAHFGRCPFFDRSAEEHQAQRGRKRKLKSQVPQHERVDGCHEHGREEQGDGSRALPAQRDCQDVDHSHESSPHHGRVRSNEEGVHSDSNDSRHSPRPLSHDSPEEKHQQPGHDRYVEP